MLPREAGCGLMHGDIFSTMEQISCALKQTQARGIGTNGILDMVQEWKGMGENLFKSLGDCFSDIESREQNVKLGRELLEKQLKDLREKEREFDSFQELKKEELKLREEELDKQLRLVSKHIDNLEVSQSEIEDLRLRGCEKLKEIEKREREIDSFRWSLEGRLREVEKRENKLEVEKRENKLDTSQSETLRELALKEELLSRKKKELVKEVKLADENFREKQKLGCGLIKRLELAFEMLEGMKVKMDEKFKELKARETMAHESLTARLNEADSIQESLEKRFRELEKIEEEFNLFQEDKRRNLESKEQQIGSLRMENLKDDKMREENLPEHQRMRRHLSQSSEQMVAKKLNTIESQELTDARFTINLHEYVDLKRTLQKDGRTLEMFINDTEKDLELMDDEIFKVLLLSSDPAKFVLDAVGGFYTPHLEKDCNEFRLRRVSILLLDQLTKMSPNIQPCVRESATKLALEWKSTMSPTAENQLEVLGFLHLLAAYNISSYFDKNELFSLVKSVAQHRQTPELCRILGLADKIAGFIQNLINEKQYLLASTYIYECGLENMFPQAAVLNYYIKHAKLSAKARCRRERRSSEAQDKAFSSEIADLRVAIEHIIKYGLESEYSPNILTARIKQLERNRASLRYRSPPPSSPPDMQRPGKSKRPWFANKRKHGDPKDAAATGLNAQMPPKGRFSPPWIVHNQRSETERYPVTSPGGIHKHQDFEDEGPMPCPSSANKRRRKNRSPFNHH